MPDRYSISVGTSKMRSLVRESCFRSPFTSHVSARSSGVRSKLYESLASGKPVLVSAARSGAVFLHGAACTIHKAQGSQWPRVQVFAPDLFAAARAGQTEAGIALWKRLAYVAITRAEEELVWVTRYMISRPPEPLGSAGAENE